MEIFFSAESKDTKEGVYEIVVSGLPEGVSFYRKDEGRGTVSVEAGTGEYEKVYTGGTGGGRERLSVSKVQCGWHADE